MLKYVVFSSIEIPQEARLCRFVNTQSNGFNFYKSVALGQEIARLIEKDE